MILTFMEKIYSFLALSSLLSSMIETQQKNLSTAGVLKKKEFCLLACFPLQNCPFVLPKRKKKASQIFIYNLALSQKFRGEREESKA